ncbi:MAG: hypothetical protein JXL97_00840, partial [Bacteroidales bacterium]|nr:hypothetical protein [Bacteroidales bacterium]
MKKTIYLLVLFSFLLMGISKAQEGTKQFMPNSTDRLYLNIGDANFARIGCPERVRLNIYLNAGETVHFGIQKAGGGNMQIRDASNNIVYGPIAVPTSGNGYIGNYTAAVTGANGTIINGATIAGGYSPLTYTAATSGSHYFEFSTTGIATYFDATVTDASNNIITNPNNPNVSAGRLWSRQWSFTTTSFTQYPVNNDFYVFTGDEFVNRVTFHMKPYVFNFVANSFGVVNSGDVIVDRQSITGNAFSSDVSEYRIFINDPDQTAFPSTTLPPPVVQAWFNGVKIYDFDYNRTPQILNINPGTITVNKNEDACPDPNVTYFKIVSNISGTSTILIDVNGDGFKVGTNDVALLADISVGENYIPWDLKDASGTTVAEGNFNCVPQLLARGPAHFPVYDAEALNEIESYSVRPFEKFDPTLYWDDAKIDAVGDWGDDNGAMDATTVDQYLINSTTPRIWTYFGDNGGYDNGNVNTLNQWFYAIDLGLSSLGFEIVKTGCVNGAAPIISDIYKSGPINTDITFTANDFDDKYADAGGNPIDRIKIISLPANGTLKLSGSPISVNDEITYANLGNITFTPTTSWMGETTFDWNAYNGAYYADNDALVHMNVNTDPTISAIPDQNLCVNTNSGPIAFTVNDAAGETDPDDIILTTTSSNLAVVPISGIVFGGSGQNRTVTVTPTTNKSGSAKVTVFASDGYSTVSSDFWVIVGPSLEITGTQQVCPGDDLSITANESGADTYEWSFGGSPIASTQNLTITNFDDATDAGVYTLTVTKGTCTGSADYDVTSHHLVTFTGNVDVCDGGIIDLLADEIVANSYSWKKGVATLGTSREFIIDPAAPGDAGANYTLTVSKDGCTIISDPFEITVNSCIPPTVDLTVNNTSIPENGGSAILTATLSNAWTYDVDVTLTYTGTATVGPDYSTTGTLITIPAGSLTGSKTINAFFDGIYEGDETVIADITNVNDGGNGAAENGVQQQTITITDNEIAPNVTLSASPLTIAENGGTSTLTATLSSSTFEDVVVNLSYSGTATGSGTDYNVATSITITAGNTTGTTDITAVNDAVYEGNETVIVDIASVSGGNASEDGTQQETVTIDDDVDLPTVTLSTSPTSIAENGGTSTLTATLSNATYEDVVVNLTYTGTATTTTDYTVATSITITAGNLTGTTVITGV